MAGPAARSITLCRGATRPERPQLVAYHTCASSRYLHAPQPKRDDGDIDTGLKQMHCRRVPDRMGRDRAVRERGKVSARCGDGEQRSLHDVR